MKAKYYVITMIGALALHPASAALEVLSSDHADLGVGFDGGDWELFVGLDDENDPNAHIEREPDEVIIFGDDSIQEISGQGSFTFLGNAGQPVWIFPQTENPSAVFLGIDTDEVAAADFTGPIDLTLTGITGPGDFVLFQFDQFLNPTVLLDSANGINSLSVPLESHGHYNWAFTAEGLYQLEFMASGILNDGFDTASMSDATAFNFGINQVPEPSTYALLFGAAVLGFVIARRRKL